VQKRTTTKDIYQDITIRWPAASCLPARLTSRQPFVELEEEWASGCPA